MRGQVIALHPAQQHQHRHVGHRQCAARAREYGRRWIGLPVTAQCQGLHLFEHRKRCTGDRNTMLPARFHALCRHDPNLIFEINLALGRTQDLAAQGCKGDFA
jgi:hypothetical protein